MIVTKSKQKRENHFVLRTTENSSAIQQIPFSQSKRSHSILQGYRDFSKLCFRRCIYYVNKNRCFTVNWKFKEIAIQLVHLISKNFFQQKFFVSKISNGGCFIFFCNFSKRYNCWLEGKKIWNIHTDTRLSRSWTILLLGLKRILFHFKLHKLSSLFDLLKTKI